MQKNNTELLKTGLASLFEGIDCQKMFFEATREKTYNQHPLGIDVDSSVERKMDISFVGNPNDTDNSVSSMIAYIRWFIEATAYDKDGKVEYLRIIYAKTSEKNYTKTSEKNEDNHDIYYEISCSCGIFICGGCDNYSIYGPDGKRILDGVFALMSVVYGVNIEKININSNPLKIPLKHNIQHFVKKDDGTEINLIQEGEIKGFRPGDRIVYTDACNPDIRGKLATVLGFDKQGQIWTQPDGQTGYHSTQGDYANIHLKKIYK